MRTDELIRVLASGIVAADSSTIRGRFAAASVLGLASAALLMSGFFGLRSDLSEVMRTGQFWLKLAIPLIAIAGVLSVTIRLSSPGRARGAGWIVLAAVVAALWASGAISFALTPALLKSQAIWGDTWRVCTACIVLLSIPSLFAEFLVLRGLAPTRPGEAGAAAGLLAGAQGLLVYCFHCPENSVAFWSIWYVLGLALPATAGIFLGKAFLRW